MEKTYIIKQENNIVMQITITFQDTETYENIQWDSRTGLVSANINGSSERKLIPFKGISYGSLQPGPFEAIGISDIQYNYWYY